MAKKCGVFVISNKLFFHRHFTLFLDYNPVGLHAYVGVLLTVNHWFLSLQYAFARVRRFHALSISPETMSGVPISILSRLTALSCSCMILLSRGGKCCNIQLQANLQLLEKFLQKCPKSPTVPLSQMELCILSKSLFINILSFLLQFLLLIWYSGTVGHLGHLVLFSSLFLSFPSLLPSP